ncbi:UNVERIFIED_CONTAM: hypothetical protein K2H54_028060 [Gekko kuhli]
MNTDQIQRVDAVVPNSPVIFPDYLNVPVFHGVNWPGTGMSSSRLAPPGACGAGLAWMQERVGGLSHRKVTHPK